MATKKSGKKASKAKLTPKAKQAVADINRLLKTKRELDLEIKKLQVHIKAMVIHSYKEK